jgi:NodT family efflux transporter outer membrane factor (OMF) lipoprotein
MRTDDHPNPAGPPRRAGADTARRLPAATKCLWPLCLLGLAGCAGTGNWVRNGLRAGPEYAAPDVALVDQWIDSSDPALIGESHGAEEAEWWRALQDPRLDHLVGEIREANLTLAAAAERIRSAHALRRVAVAGLLPQSRVLEASYAYNRQSATAYPFGDLDRRLEDDLFQELYDEDYDQWAVGGAVQWELDLWGRYRRGLEAATAEAAAAEFDFRDAEISLVAATVNTYVAFRELQHRIALTEANAKAQQDVLGIARARVRNGAATELDEQEAIANLARTMAQIPVLRVRLREENNRLCILRGQPVHDLSQELGSGAIPTVPDTVAVGIPIDLLRRRPDIRAAERRLAQQSARIGIAAAEYFPAFVLQGSIRQESENEDDLADGDSLAGEIWPRLQWNILDSGRIGNTVEAQEARYQELLLEYRQAVLRAHAEAENAIHAFLQAQKRLRILATAVSATDRSAEIATRQYQAGAVTFGRLSLLQVLRVSHQDEATQARADVVRAFVLLYKALGGAG